MLHVCIPYCVHAHNGIRKENWVVLDVGTTEVEKPCKEEIHILFTQNEEKKKSFIPQYRQSCCYFLKLSLKLGRCLNKSQSPV